jgi:hypothetical protein
MAEASSPAAAAASERWGRGRPRVRSPRQIKGAACERNCALMAGRRSSCSRGSGWCGGGGIAPVAGGESNEEASLLLACFDLGKCSANQNGPLGHLLQAHASRIYSAAGGPAARRLHRGPVYHRRRHRAYSLLAPAKQDSSRVRQRRRGASRYLGDSRRLPEAEPSRTRADCAAVANAAGRKEAAAQQAGRYLSTEYLLSLPGDCLLLNPVPPFFLLSSLSIIKG